MVDEPSATIEKKLHAEAEELARRYALDYATSLVLNAKFAAARNDDEIVLKKHIQEARELLSRGRLLPWFRQFIVVVGGGLLGNFVRTLYTDLPQGNTTAVAVNAILGIVGLLAIFFCVRG